MNIALILAAGVGQRMRSGGLPKQFLKIMGKPIVIYTLEKFQRCEKVDAIVVVCHGSYIEFMKDLISQYHVTKARSVIVGGKSRQSSIRKGLEQIAAEIGNEEALVIVHDGVRPLVEEATIQENIRVAGKQGCAVTVHPVTESVVITDGENAKIHDFKKRADTYSLTSPQTFRLKELLEAYKRAESKDPGEKGPGGELPLLDAAMIYASEGGEVHLVKEQNTNLKITTPEDFYFLKAILDLEENKYIFGL